MSQNKEANKEIQKIINYWNKQPCIINHWKLEKETKEYFNEVEKDILLNHIFRIY